MKILFIFAHPDDESFSSAGTISLLSKKATIKLITVTKGEKGQLGNPAICKQEELGKVREQELRKAAKILGISKIYFLNYIDGTLNKIPQKEISSKILKILNKELPDVVITFNKEGLSNHPDHIQISKTATMAFYEYMKNVSKHVRLYYTEIPVSLVEKLKKEKLLYTAFGQIKGTSNCQITTIIDISKTLKQKIKALKSHQTQKKDWQRYLKRFKFKEAKKEFFRLVFENNLI